MNKEKYFSLIKKSLEDDKEFIDFNDIIKANKEDKHEYEYTTDYMKALLDRSKRERNLLSSREEKLKRYMEVTTQISELINMKNELYSEIEDINSNLCALRGHILVDIAETSGPAYYRRCCICGKIIKENELKNNDVIVRNRKLVPNKKESNQS